MTLKGLLRRFLTFGMRAPQPEPAHGLPPCSYEPFGSGRVSVLRVFSALPDATGAELSCAFLGAVDARDQLWIAADSSVAEALLEAAAVHRARVLVPEPHRGVEPELVDAAVQMLRGEFALIVENDGKPNAAELARGLERLSHCQGLAYIDLDAPGQKVRLVRTSLWEGWKVERRAAAIRPQLILSPLVAGREKVLPEAWAALDEGFTQPPPALRPSALVISCLELERAPVGYVEHFDAVLLVAEDLKSVYRIRGRIYDQVDGCLAHDPRLVEQLRLLFPHTYRMDGDRLSDWPLLEIAAHCIARREVKPSPVKAVSTLRPYRKKGDGPAILLQVQGFTQGGVENVVMDLMGHLEDRGWRPRLLILGELSEMGETALQGRGLQYLRMAPHPDHYGKLLADGGFSIVNAHYSTFGGEICAAMNVRFVQTVHNMYLWLSSDDIDAYRRMDAHTAAYLCVSPNVARYADVRLGLSLSRMVIIPNGCRAGDKVSESHRRALAREVREEFGIPPEAAVFLNVATVQPGKGQHIAVGALELASRSGLELHLILLGRVWDEPYRLRLDAMIAEKGLRDRVHFAGFRSDVSRFHAAADALVMPSYLEGWSLAISEAVEAGLPVIATDVGGAVEQLRGTSGQVIPAFTEDLTVVDLESLLHWFESPCEKLQEKLAEAMLKSLKPSREDSPPTALHQCLTPSEAYDLHVRVFEWLLQGGHPACCRPWSRIPQRQTGFA